MRSPAEESGPNRAARFARQATIRAHRADSAARWAVALLLLVGWFALTALELVLHLRELEGTRRAQPLLTWVGDVLYAPFTFLAPQAEYVHGEDLKWAGQLGRFLGVGLPVLTIVWTFQRRLVAQAARLVIRLRGGGHAVILGDEGSADALAAASSLAGEVVVLLDPSLAGAPDRAVALQRAGVIVPAATPLAGQIAVAARGARARDVVAWFDDPAAGLAAALAAREALPAGEREIAVAIEAPEMQRALRRAPHLLSSPRDRIRPISRIGMAVRQALGLTALVEEACRLQQKRVVVRLHGAGPALRWAAEAVLRHNWSMHLGAPVVILDPPREGDGWEPLLGAMAGAERAGGVFAPGHAPLVVRASGDGTPTPLVTRHLVDAGADDATLVAALDLAARLRQEHAGATPSVQAVLRGAQVAQVLAGDGALRLSPAIVTHGACTVQDLLARPLDEDAARLHLRYEQAHGGANLPASGRWEDLAEAYVHSNRAAADHHAVKRFDARRAGWQPGEALAPAVLDAMAAMEHRRWSSEKLLDGWRSGPRDDARRFHPDLVPWEALDEPARDKDRAVVREALGL